MIDCVTIATSHCFPGNLIAAQHRLRYQEVIAKEDWSNIYVADEMEFDRYDNVATEYFIARNSDGEVARGLPIISDDDPLHAFRRLFLSVCAGTAVPAIKSMKQAAWCSIARCSAKKRGGQSSMN